MSKKDFRKKAKELTWSEIDLGRTLPTREPALRFAAVGKALLLAAYNKTVFMSSDAGDSWQELGRGFQPDEDIRAVTANQRGIFAGAFRGLYCIPTLTPTATSEWKLERSEFGVFALMDDTFMPGTERDIAAGLKAHLPTDPTAGESAFRFFRDSAPDSIPVGYFSMRGGSFPESMATIKPLWIVGSFDFGLHLSFDDGATFIAGGLLGLRPRSVGIILHPVEGQFFFAATEAQTLFRVPISGGAPERIGPNDIVDRNLGAVMIVVDQMLVAVFQFAGVFVSPACGRKGTWTKLGRGFPEFKFQNVLTFGRIGTKLLASVSLPTGESKIYRIDLAPLLE